MRVRTSYLPFVGAAHSRKRILPKNPLPCLGVSLHGPLRCFRGWRGAGKTILVQGIAGAVGEHTPIQFGRRSPARPGFVAPYISPKRKLARPAGASALYR